MLYPAIGCFRDSLGLNGFSQRESELFILGRFCSQPRPAEHLVTEFVSRLAPRARLVPALQVLLRARV